MLIFGQFVSHLSQNKSNNLFFSVIIKTMSVLISHVFEHKPLFILVYDVQCNTSLHIRIPLFNGRIYFSELPYEFIAHVLLTR